VSGRRIAVRRSRVSHGARGSGRAESARAGDVATVMADGILL
jgi:hypothetical protein